MFEWYRRLCAIAKVDGITFYSKSAFNEYMTDKEREKKGLHRYSFRVEGNISLGRAMTILEKAGVFDYTYERDFYMADVFNIHYWSNRLILTYDPSTKPTNKPTNKQPKE